MSITSGREVTGRGGGKGDGMFEASESFLLSPPFLLLPSLCLPFFA
jgi:hypothetical protein